VVEVLAVAAVRMVASRTVAPATLQPAGGFGASVTPEIGPPAGSSKVADTVTASPGRTLAVAGSTVRVVAGTCRIGWSHVADPV
jgi:hypothetical protein